MKLTEEQKHKLERDHSVTEFACPTCPTGVIFVGWFDGDNVRVGCDTCDYQTDAIMVRVSCVPYVEEDTT